MPNHANTDEVALCPDNHPGYKQLNVGKVFKEDRPGNRNFNLVSNRQRFVSPEEESTAGYVKSGALSRFQQLAPMERFPMKIESEPVSPLESAVAMNAVNRSIGRNIRHRHSSAQIQYANRRAIQIVMRVPLKYQIGDKDPPIRLADVS
jgi:hypothetical protein